MDVHAINEKFHAVLRKLLDLDRELYGLTTDKVNGKINLSQLKSYKEIKYLSFF